MSLAGALPLFMSACGGSTQDADGDSGQNADLRETRSLNFDLSHGSIAQPRLQLVGSPHHNAPLKAHTAESRALQRQLNPLLVPIPDARLTHYIEDVNLPARALQLVGVMGRHPSTGAYMLAGYFLHVPKSSLEVVSARRLKQGRPARSLSAKLQTYGATASALGDAPIEAQIAFNSMPWDVATWLVFQHPAITNLDPDLGADILDRIQNLPCDPNDASCSPYLSTLAFQVATLIGSGNYPSTTASNSWATLIPVFDPDTGQAVLDDSGNPVFSFEMNNGLKNAVAAMVKSILNDINDDPTFSGTNWQPADGGTATQPVATATALAAAAASSRSRTLADSTTFGVTSTIAVGKRISGIRLLGVEADAMRNIELTVRNEFLRSAGVYVEYRDANGSTLAVANPTSLDSDRAKYTTLISPDLQVMGIPLQGSLVPSTLFNFTLPDAATQAVVYYGGLGLGGSDAFSKEALMGSIFTLVVNIGLPSICLVLGISAVYNKGLTAAFNSALEDPIVASTVLNAVVQSGSLGGGIQSAVTNLSLEPFLIGAGATILQIFLKCAPRLGQLLAAAAVTSKVAESAPIVGLALWVLSTAADVATIGETIIECIACPAIDRTVIALTMDSTVRISRDPNDFQFPATARTFHIDAYYDGGATPRTFDGTLTTGQVDPIDATLTGVPSGGTVVVHASFYSATKCLVGTAVSDKIVNLPDAAALIPLTLKELAMPLDAQTAYQHQLKLVYAAGARAWSASAPPPTLTRANLCQGNDGAICALHGLTVHTASGMAGYGFNAGGQGVDLCGGGGASSLSTIENVFLGTNPETGLKFSSCGASQPIGIAYDPHGLVTGGHNFFLQPAADSFYHLRGVDLDSTNFDMNQATTWGRFQSPLDSLCVMASGYVVGVNRSTHKMEVLRLPAQPEASDNSATANTFSALKSGYGSRAGLLDTPVAVATYSGNLLVLEQGNQRVQAFDADGSNVKPFKDASGNPSPLMPLRPEPGATVTYLDIAVEPAGYVYVLSYINSGNNPANYRLDVYTPTGQFLCRTANVASAAIAVDLFRNVYSLNYEVLSGSPRVEPSLSQWLPVSATACASASVGAMTGSGAATASCTLASSGVVA